MTMTMSSLMSEHEQPPPEGGQGEPGRQLLAMPTHEIKLSPQFVQALKKVAPKVRRRKLPYILALAVLVAAGSLAVVPAARHRVAAAAYRLWHKQQPALSVESTASAPVQPIASAVEAPAPVVSAPIVIPPVVISSAAADTSSSSAKPSKPPKKWQRQSPH